MKIVSETKNKDLINQLKPPSHTIQGFFIVSADGQSYDWMNWHDPTAVKQFLGNGLAWFRNNRTAAVTISDTDVKEPFSPHPPADASVIRVFSRIRPVPAGSNELNEAVGRDHMWIFSDEVKALVDASSNRSSSIAFPQSWAARMTRFHIIDNVRGEPDMWREHDVKKATFTTRVLKQEGDIRTFQFAGLFSQVTANKARGLDGKIEGEFDVDCRSFRVTRWRAYSQSLAFGRSTFTPDPPKGKFPLVIAMVETNDEISKIVPPQAVSYGEDYHHAQIDVQ